MCEWLKQAASKTAEPRGSESSNLSESAKGNMNPLNHNLRLKRSPERESRELSCAGVAERSGTRLLIGDYMGSNPIACTMKNSTASVGVVRPAHPCGGQQVICWHSSEAERRLYTPTVGGSIPSASTNRMRGAARKSRQPRAGVMVRRISHKDFATSSTLVIGTYLFRRNSVGRVPVF